VSMLGTRSEIIKAGCLIRRYFAGYVLCMVEVSHASDSIHQELAPPWARLIGRTFDISLSMSVLTLVTDCLIEIVHSPMKGVWLNYRQYLWLVFLPIALFIDALVMSLFGSTIGKTIVGVKVVALDGNWLSFQQAVRRNFILYLHGYALGVPVLSFYAMYLSYKRLYRDGLLSWDKLSKTQIYDFGASSGRNAMAVLILIVLIWSFSKIDAYIIS